MEITSKNEGDVLTVGLEGRLDTMTAPTLETYLSENLKDVTNIVFDCSPLAYISSAGLRVLLSTQKKMNGVSGTMKLINVNDLIMDILDAVGFLDIFIVENPS